VKTILLKKLDYIFVLRPTLFFPIWTVALAGRWAQERFALVQSPVRIWMQFPDVLLGLWLLFFTSVMAAAFLVNQISDVESDRLNGKLYLLASGAITPRQAMVETVVLIALPLAALIWLRADLAIWAAAAYLVTGFAYSCRPLMLENRPWGGLMTNLVGALIIFSYGWLTGGTHGWDMVFRASPYLLGILAVYFLTTIPDIPGDTATGKITVAVRYGIRKVIVMALVTHLLALTAAALSRDWVAVVPMLAVLPFFWQTFRRQSVASALRTNKMAALALSLVVCVRFPFYLLFLVLVYFSCKWYYRQRFQLEYPSMRL
jgi:4-hydroxybenzoate polyprenyltransferase